ncbi:DUF3231 family protein [Bacillus sp. ISL-18]|uniref:DUF3231 family protein n=1 Tax=Bacillus sp. ISL-18 TaxID=2819118 RepID=UPI001BEBAEEF|nr:DUF3231 family protein [Bacillus sp. ISL-18]MBT2655797.1 DUF3231 family protein [Bacillus sp. ISL-18]
MEINHNIKLTGPEITSLWTQYQSDSLNLRVNTYMHHHLEEENEAIKLIFQDAIASSENNLREIESFFNRIHYPIPQGFTEHDVNIDTPKLFSDHLCLKYLHEMTIHGLSAYSVALTVSTCGEMRKFYEDKVHDTIKLYN